MALLLEFLLGLFVFIGILLTISIYVVYLSDDDEE
jgi:hypothetical protein